MTLLVGAAILPTAPLLVPGVSASLPDGVAAVCDAIDATVESLPDADAVVLLAAGERGLYQSQEASLAGIGRPDIAQPVKVPPTVAERITGLTQYSLVQGEALPLSLSVLALLVGPDTPLIPIAVPQTASFEALVGVGTAIAEGLSQVDVPAAVVAAGDLSAGLTDRSPLGRIGGAADWDLAAVAAAESGRLDGLARLGPAEAARVGARGWAPLAALHGACARAKIGLVVRHYSAPRGVGYLVAGG